MSICQNARRPGKSRSSRISTMSICQNARRPGKSRSSRISTMSSLHRSPSPAVHPAHRRRPLLPPLRRVESEGVGVTSSILPIFIPERARARRADWAPGPGVLVPLPSNYCQHLLCRMIANELFLPPVALILICNALIPNSLHLVATSCAANMAA